MPICLPCAHEVADTAPHWDYEDVTFYFCSTGCEKRVKMEPERWLAIAKSGTVKATPHDPHHSH